MRQILAIYHGKRFRVSEDEALWAIQLNYNITKEQARELLLKPVLENSNAVNIVETRQGVQYFLDPNGCDPETERMAFPKEQFCEDTMDSRRALHCNRPKDHEGDHICFGSLRFNGTRTVLDRWENKPNPVASELKKIVK